MKLATFKVDGIEHIGAVEDGGLIDLSDRHLARNMIELIARWPELREKVLRIVAEEKPRFLLGDVHLCAPVPRPQKVMAIGLNYADHIAESGAQTPEKQIWFAKLGNAVNGPHDPIQVPKASKAIDWEAELVFVIGRRCRHVPKERAQDVIFGYACGNDISVRDWQFHTPQWLVGKSFDTHAPIGPWIVTADEVGDPHALGIRCLVNGTVKQNSNTKNLVFNCFDQIAYLSQAMTLEPGDMVFTGTPGGVGQSMKPPQFLKPGDTVRVEIDRIGAIEAKMIAEP
ncbi:MAG TPA: fumarylacetoacetate hydrolase family protein [Rhizomicrobium sp.]|jgi:ureidoglycolate lyase|nr:fumarylacetoacetate hydrolase family protein [Rhizomicrobium sp.]